MQWKKMALPPAEDVLIECESRPSGLLPHEVKERFQRFGANEIVSETSPWKEMVQRRFRSSFLYLLFAAALLSFFLGEKLEAVLILIFIAINVCLETYQEYHSERTLRLLKRYLVSHVKVRRHGEIVQIESRFVVPGDILIVDTGDRLAADIRFIETTGIVLDESVMTGESISVHKDHQALPTATTEMSEAKNIGFAGTVVVGGHGVGVVLATGRKTALGDIATLSEETIHESKFEKDIAAFSRFIVRLVLITLALLFVANVLLRGDNSDIPALLIFSIALAVSVVPEALPVIITVALSRGSLKLANKKVVVKRLSAIEDLGSIEVLCTDKTGTITENALIVTETKGPNARKLLMMGSMASQELPTGRASLHDPFDIALWNSLVTEEQGTVMREKRYDILPFDPERRRNSVLVRAEKGYQLIVRGAFEEVLALSTNLTPKERSEWIAWGNARGVAGERVLAVAVRNFTKKRALEASLETGLHAVGIIAFRDPLKKTAIVTLEAAKKMGVAVKIITGDSREVAGAVAHAVGLIDDPKAVITGAELMALSSAEQQEKVETCAVFARVSPKEKYHIIKLIQNKHEVGFLGEGINDAPALKLANVAIVVQGASDIAKEAADVVLLQRNLGAVVDGIREGRIIFANIKKYLLITLTSNFGNFYAVALASLFLPFVPLLPIQILFLNLLSDFPMISIATDNVDEQEMAKPREYKVGGVILMATFLGLVSSLFDFILFATFYREGAATLQTAWFMLSVITEVILIFSLRTRFLFFRARRPAVILVILSFVAMGVVLITPFLSVGREVFKFIRPSGELLLVILGLAIAYFITSEVVKRYYVRHFEPAESR